MMTNIHDLNKSKVICFGTGGTALKHIDMIGDQKYFIAYESDNDKLQLLFFEICMD